MKNPSIRKVTLENLKPLQEIGRKTFYETFSAYNSEENMQKYLNEGFSAEKLTTELQNENTLFYFVTDDDNQPVGYLKVNTGPAQTELKDEKALEIERIYVLKAYQGMRLGLLLFQQAIYIAQRNNVEYVWLGVWEKNLKAINFYQNLGFVTFDTHIFRLGDEEQTDLLMKFIPER